MTKFLNPRSMATVLARCSVHLEIADALLFSVPASPFLAHDSGLDRVVIAIVRQPVHRLAMAADVEQVEADETLIDEMLKLSPLERLRLHDRMVATARALREGYEQVRDADDASR